MTEPTELQIKKWLQEGAERQDYALIVADDLIEGVPKPFYVREKTQMNFPRSLVIHGRYKITNRIYHNISPSHLIAS